jgi:hypothetical protein
MIETIILEEPSARCRFRTAPCLEEREQYLFHLMRQGYGPAYLRTVSFFLLRVIEFLQLTALRTVGLDEILAPNLSRNSVSGENGDESVAVYCFLALRQRVLTRVDRKPFRADHDVHNFDDGRPVRIEEIHDFP